MLNLPSTAQQGQDFTVSPQNWGIIQHKDGRIFVGNTSGVLSWDGNTWELVRGTEDKRFFKFAEDEDGRIFSAGLKDLGYLSADSVGKVEFVSIKEYLPPEAQDFEILFRVASQGNKIFFMGGEHLFRWENGAFKTWKDDNRFSRIFVSGEKVYISTRTQLFELVGDELKLILEEKELHGLDLRFLSQEDQGNNIPEPNFWMVSRKNGVHKYSQGNINQLNPGLDSLEVMNVTDLGEGLRGLGTNGHGFVVVNLLGEVVEFINYSSGLISQQVSYPYLDKMEGVWLCHYSGISRKTKQSPFEIYGFKERRMPNVSSTYKWKGKIFIGTFEGPYVIADPLSGEVSKVDVSSEEVYGFFELGNHLWMVASAGIFKIDDQLRFVEVIHSPGTVSFCRGSKDPNTLFLSNDKVFITQYKYIGESWSEIGDTTLLPHLGYNLVQDNPGKVYFSYDKISYLNTESSRITTFSEGAGLPDDLVGMEIRLIDDQILVSGEFGIYRLDPATQRFTPFSDWGPQFSEQQLGAYSITPTRNGDIWFISDNFTGRLIRGEDGYTLDSMVLAAPPISDCFSIYEDPEGMIWIGGTEGLIKYNPRIPQNYEQEYHCLVRKVTVNDDSIIFYGTYADETGLILTEQPSSYVPTLPYRDNHLTFKYSAPFYEAMDKITYSHQLVGQDANWTKWTEKTEAEYTNLREGDYTFQVRAKNVYGTISKIGEYKFVVNPPWYRTWLAFIIYGLLTALLVVFIVRMSIRRLVAAKKKLEGIVEERTKEIQRQMEKLAEQKEIISEEKEKSDNLLLNILPQSTSEELKEHGSARPQYFEEVSILFTDFKGFTHIAENLSPKQLVDEINETFSAFDRITKQHGIEKIKTIGDAYMAAGGLPERNQTHAVDVVTAALKIRDFMQEYHAQKIAKGLPGFEIRLGIHSGPVVAGIVGLHKFQYDIWGDSVNLAARMESSGKVGKVNISEATYQLVKDHFDCTFRGKVMAKNKGEVAMYFVEWKSDQ